MKVVGMNENIPVKDRLILWRVETNNIRRCEVLNETAKTFKAKDIGQQAIGWTYRILKSDIDISVFYTKEEATQCLLDKLHERIRWYEMQIESIRARIDEIKER